MVTALKPIEGSKAIAAAGYDEGTRTLRIQYTSGRIYDRQDVSPEQAQAFEEADSKGRWINGLSSDDHPAVPVDMADSEGGEAA